MSDTRFHHDKSKAYGRKRNKVGKVEKTGTLSVERNGFGYAPENFIRATLKLKPQTILSDRLLVSQTRIRKKVSKCSCESCKKKHTLCESLYMCNCSDIDPIYSQS